MADVTAKQYMTLKRKYNQKEEENMTLREQIREFQCNTRKSSGVNQSVVTRLEMERDAAKGDCVRLREEICTLRNDMKRLKDCQCNEQLRLEQAQKDFDNCVAQFEVERCSLTGEIKQLTEELRLLKDKMRELQTDAGEQRTRCNHLKLVNEQAEQELRTTQDLLQQAEAELANALDRVQEINELNKQLDWDLKEARQERTRLKANMARIDQEKDSLLIKIDEKTEQNVRLDAEVESRSCRIANLESFIADLQKKLDVALDTAARSEQSSRQHTHELDRLQKELDKMDRHRDVAVKENSRLQEDFAAVTVDNQRLSRSLEASKREVEDLKLQLQQYVAEVRRFTQRQEEREAERVALLEQFRSLTVESASLENKHHSLESEAKSTKSNLREAENRIHDLEACLEEKNAMVHGYEKQIRELTQQVAKLERKVHSHSRAESASRDISRELETQKHCYEQVSCKNRQLQEEVCRLRSEMDHLQEQLGKERKNSATLENVLASSRQETLQRTRDNGELKTQVQCLQSKLEELQGKLEHGSEALRRCKGECEDYQAQVCELKREVTNQRFERARMEQTGRCRRQKRAATHPRSRSLQSKMYLSPSYSCPCCFLNHISTLRQSYEFSTEQLQGKSVPESLDLAETRKEKETLHDDCSSSSIFTFLNDMILKNNKVSKQSGGDSEEFMFPERLINSKLSKSDSTFVDDKALQVKNFFNNLGTQYKSNISINKNEMLSYEIDMVLEEHRRIIKKFDLPISDIGKLKLNTDQMSSEGDFITHDITTVEANKHKILSTKKQNIHKTFKPLFLASGDHSNGFNINEATNPDIASNLSSRRENQYYTQSTKPTFHLNDEPVKLPKAFEFTFSTEIDTDINKDSPSDKNIAVKMLFSPRNGFNDSSSFGSEGAASSVYVTAANSMIDFQVLYTGSNSICATTSQHKNLNENNLN